MALKLMYITNNPRIAQIAERSGVDWIFIDLEIKGKVERQGHLDTVISDHKISDIKPIKNILTESKLLVRVNPIHNNSVREIDQVIESGAEIIMLPYFKTKQEVEVFLKAVNKRVITVLLLETPEAVENLDSILEIQDIDYIHIGLNDLHLGYKLDFMFELVSSDVVDNVIKKISRTQINYGFGGIASLGGGLIPAEIIIDEHYRLKSKMVILSRSFIDINKYNNNSDLEKDFKKRINDLRKYESKIKNYSNDYFDTQHKVLKLKVDEILNKIRGEKK